MNLGHTSIIKGKEKQMLEQLIGSMCQSVKNMILSLKLDTNTVFIANVFKFFFM